MTKLDERIKTLTTHPYIGTLSGVVKGVRGILIAKHNKLFYKVSKTKITIIDMVDTRIDPKRNRYI
jgi:plasmid stabilization system protein ParE